MLNTKISAFKKVEGPDAFRPYTISLAAWINTVMNPDTRPEWCEAIATVLATEGEVEQRLMKADLLPAIIPGAICERGHRKDNIVSITGLMQFDVDGKHNLHLPTGAELRAAVANLDEVLFCAVSARGTGCWGLVRIPVVEPHYNELEMDERGHILDDYDARYEQLIIDFARYGVKLDRTVKHPHACRFWSPDPDAYVNPDAVVYMGKAAPPPPPPSPSADPVTFRAAEPGPGEYEEPPLTPEMEKALQGMTKALLPGYEPEQPTTKARPKPSPEPIETKARPKVPNHQRDGHNWVHRTHPPEQDPEVEAPSAPPFKPSSLSPPGQDWSGLSGSTQAADDAPAPAAKAVTKGTPVAIVEAAPDPRAKWEPFKIDYLKELEPPPIALEVDDVPILTLGNFATVIGYKKTRKTFLMSWMMAALLTGRKVGPFTGTLPPDRKRVLFFDTEQAEFDCQRSARRVLYMAGDSAAKWFDTYHLRAADYKTRLKCIDEIIENTPDVGAVVIDGMRDTVTSVNDEEQATMVVGELLRWTEQKHIAIIVALHKNKTGPGHARGHLGTELLNKGYLTMDVDRDATNREVSKVESESSRGKDFEPFAFTISEEHRLLLPELVTGWTPRKQSENAVTRIDPESVHIEQHRKVLTIVADRAEKSHKGKPSYNTLLALIQYAYGKCGDKVGKNKAGDFATWYREEGYIVQKGIKGTAKAYYVVDLSKFE